MNAHTPGNDLITVQHTNTEENTMNNANNNSTLNFIKDLGETLAYVGQHAFDWIMQASWKKLLLVSLLTIFTGGLIHLSSLANTAVFGAILVKLFVNKDKQTSSQV
ncbi:hypothetical protein [Undibacterium sp. Ji49W]|uniref:hypothetical protein n=1 Tax=Undibacterium sp. Ji49W TaxID=3413040 RepID=UPI003BF0CA1C